MSHFEIDIRVRVRKEISDDIDAVLDRIAASICWERRDNHGLCKYSCHMAEEQDSRYASRIKMILLCCADNEGNMGFGSGIVVGGTESRTDSNIGCY